MFWLRTPEGNYPINCHSLIYQNPDCIRQIVVPASPKMAVNAFRKQIYDGPHRPTLAKPHDVAGSEKPKPGGGKEHRGEKLQRQHRREELHLLDPEIQRS